MRVSLVALTSLLALASAAPQLEARKDRIVICSVQSTNKEIKTSKKSPTVGDCEKLRDEIENWGEKNVKADIKEHPLGEYKSCAFKVKSRGDQAIVDIGNGDIINQIDNSIRDYAKEYDGVRRVGATGEFECSVHAIEDSAAITWTIYHT